MSTMRHFVSRFASLSFLHKTLLRTLIAASVVAMGLAGAAELNILESVVVKFGPGAELVVRDKITTGKGATFTSQKDDNAAGQTNPTAQVPAAADWRGIRVEKSSLPYGPQLGESTIIRYAGGSNGAGLTLRGVNPALTYMQFADNVVGLRTLQVASPQLTGVSFLRNGIGLEINDNSTPVISSGQFARNTTNAIVNKTPSTIIQATGNWWGHSTGPRDSIGNPLGQGDAVSAGVDYGQFLAQAPLINPTIQMANPAAYIEQSTVAVKISCVNAVEYRIAENGAFAGVAFQTLTDGQATLNVPLSTGDGRKQLSVQFRSADGIIVSATLAGGVLVDTLAPEVSISSPAPASVITQPITVEVTATDTAGIAKVEFYVDNQLVATRNGTPYSFGWNTDNVPVGQHTLKVVANDTVGRIAEQSRTVTVALSPTVPRVISQGLLAANYTPATGYNGTNAYQAFNGGSWRSPAFSGTLTVDLGSQYMVSRVKYIPGIWTRSGSTSETRVEQVLVSPSPNGPWTTAFSQSVFARDSALRDIIFTPVAGRYVQLSIPSSDSWVTVTDVQVFGTPTEVAPDTAGPQVINVKANGAALANGASFARNGTVTLEAGDPSGISRIEVLLNGSVVSALAGPNGVYSAVLNLNNVPNGIYTLEIRATDSLNNVSTTTFNITVAHVPPNAPQLSQPANGTTTRDTVQAIIGQAQANSEVQLYLNNNPIGPVVVAGSNGSFRAPITLVSGANQIQATAADMWGTSALSAPLSVKLDTTVPAAISNLITAAQAGGKIRLSWTRSTDPNVTYVDIYRASTPFTVAGEAVKLARVPAATITYDDLPTQDGTYYYRLVSVNNAGTLSDLSNQAQATSDSKAPRASIAYAPLGKVDSATGRIGQGKVNVTMTVTEPLQAAPYVAVVPNGSAPITIDLVKQDDTHYTGSFTVDSTSGSGTANALFSARDLAGNRGTDIDAGATLKIDTVGPAVTGIAISPVSPVKNDTAQTITATFTLSKAMKSGESPGLNYLLSGPVRNPSTLSGITQVSTTTWSGTFTLPADAGAGTPETFSFSFRGIDDLDNVSTRIAAPVNRFQVYQGALPPFASPIGLKAEAKPGGKVRLSWLAVEGASLYQIYRQGPSDTTLVATQRTTGIEYIDTTTQDGKYQYAVASVRQSNDQESLSSQSAPVEVTASATAPAAPGNLTLRLAGGGIQASWQAPLNSTVASYNLYRSSASSINTTEGLAPIKTGIKQLGAVDANPSPTDHAYVVTALDAAGNESAISNSVYLNFDLLPVATLKVEQIGNDLPQLTWTPTRSANAGYNVYVGPDAGKVKLTATPTTSLTFPDSGYTSGERRYTVAAVDSNDVEQPRLITLPNVSIQIVSGMPIKRGVMNKLQVQVTNTSTDGFDNAKVIVRLGNIDHRSEVFSLAGNETRMLPVIVGGYADLQANAPMQVAVEIVPNEGELIKIAKNTTADIADGSLVVGMATEEFTRGGTGNVRLTIENTTEADVELLTALSNGAANSSELRFKILDNDGNVLATQPYKQIFGASVITLANGMTVARIPAGANYVSDLFSLNVPGTSPNSIRVRLEVDKLRYHTGQSDEVIIAGRGSEKVVSLMDTAYLGEVTDVNPISSFGDQDVIITGRALERQSKTPLPNTRLKLVLNQQGFERIFSVLTDASGSFTYAFKPTITDSGLYKVSAVHPEITDRPEQKAFTINRVTVGPTPYKLDVPKNYPFTIPFTAKAGPGTAATNLRLTLDAASQPTGQLPAGVDVQLLTPVTLAERQTLNVPVTFTANNDAQPSGSLIFNVISDEHPATPIGQVKVDYSLSEAKPFLTSTPNLIETGLAQGGSQIESVTVENKGLQDALNLQFTLAKADGTPAPGWISLVSQVDGTLAIGGKRVIDVAFNPPSGTAEGVYEFKLQVQGDNVPQQTLNVYASVTQSGQGNVLFKAADIYTATIGKDGRAIPGLANATITLQNEDVVTVTQELVTDSLGEALFQNLPAGSYKFRARAANHQETGGRLLIKPGITANQPIFLDYNLITVEWSVREVTIQDRYDITLNTTFETDVPAAVVVMQPASINLPTMNPGDVHYGELTLSNFGLVRADNVKQQLPRSDAFFRYEFLVDVPNTLEAKQRVTIPYRVVALQSLEGGVNGAASGGGCYSYSNTMSVTCNYVCSNGIQSSCGASTSWFSASNSTCTPGVGTPAVGGVGGVGGVGSIGSGSPSPAGTSIKLKGKKCVYVPKGGGESKCE